MVLGPSVPSNQMSHNGTSFWGEQIKVNCWLWRKVWCPVQRVWFFPTKQPNQQVCTDFCVWVTLWHLFPGGTAIGLGEKIYGRNNCAPQQPPTIPIPPSHPPTRVLFIARFQGGIEGCQMLPIDFCTFLSFIPTKINLLLKNSFKKNFFVYFSQKCPFVHHPLTFPFYLPGKQKAHPIVSQIGIFPLHLGGITGNNHKAKAASS